MINDGPTNSGGWRNVLQRVAPQLRAKKDDNIYVPVAVPLGPYHHGRVPEFQVAEQLKKELRDMVCGDEGKASSMRGRISEALPEIREFYDGAAEYGDEALAEMMLRDTCFLFCCIIVAPAYVTLILDHLRMSEFIFVYHDVFKLENQIPLWLLSWLMQVLLTDGDGNSPDIQEILRNFLNANFEADLTAAPWDEEEDEPLHLLEASHCLLFSSASGQGNSEPPAGALREPRSISLLSVTHLEAKGVRFRTSSRSLDDISFVSFSTHGRLHLPMFSFNHYTEVMISNLVALEMSSGGGRPLKARAIGYVSFMKTLVEKAEDVKLLRERGVVYNALANDHEVVKLLHSIDTLGFAFDGLSYDVKFRIREHCNNKGKTKLRVVLL